MHRASRRPSMFILGATLVALALAGSGCATAAKNKLLVAEGTGSSEAGVKIWAVSPGDELNDDQLVIDAAAGPNSISTRNDDGTTWVNGLGRDWNNTGLLSFTGASSSKLITAEPGGDPHDLVDSSTLQSTVIRRGVYVRTADGCELATDSTTTESLGKGSCAISSDERWVVSWPGTNGSADTSLTIRDMRHGTRSVKGLGTVVNAVVLSDDARIFAVVQTDTGDQGVVIDATDGSEIGRTDVYPYLDVTTLGAEATGFVILTSSGGSDSALSYVDTDAKVTEIENGYYLAPVSNGHEITYISFGKDDLTKSSVRTWSPGDDEPETLLTGQVGAGTADGELVVVREVSSAENSSDGTASGATVEFWRPGAGEELTKVLTIPAPADSTPIAEGGSGVVITKAWVQGHTAYLQVDQGTTSSFVRIDLSGDHSDAPVQNTAGLLLESLDVDGTALLTVADTAKGEEQLMVVGPHDEEPVTRATFTQTGVNLIHEGTIYVTALSGTTEAPEISVRSVRATGDADPQLLWKDSQIAGATWPEQNGATITSITTVGGLLAAQAASQQQQGGSSTADAGTGGGAVAGTDTAGGAAGTGTAAG